LGADDRGRSGNLVEGWGPIAQVIDIGLGVIDARGIARGYRCPGAKRQPVSFKYAKNMRRISEEYPKNMR
jgi:hypothetical protein